MDGVAAVERAYAAQRRRRRLWHLAAGAAFLACFLVAAEIGRLFEVVRVGDGRQLNLVAGLPRLGEFVAKTLPMLRWETLGADLAEWLRPWRVWGRLLRETMLIAFMATVLASGAALLLSFPSPRGTLAPRRWMQWTTRRGLELARTVPDLVWALIFVYCFGAGPMAGVLAIAVHGTGALGKLFAEANENADMRQVEAVRAAGCDWFQQVRYGAVPQVLPVFLSYTLLRFEINVRSSSIIGFVGAGGLGQELRLAISLQSYTDLSALFLIILALVILIDLGCERLRHAPHHRRAAVTRPSAADVAAARARVPGAFGPAGAAVRARRGARDQLHGAVRLLPLGIRVRPGAARRGAPAVRPVLRVHVPAGDLDGLAALGGGAARARPVGGDGFPRHAHRRGARISARVLGARDY